jgi:hypothetical protein
MLKVEIKSTEVMNRNFVYKTGEKVGQQGVIHTQEGWAYTVDQSGKPHPYPQRITLNLDVEDGQQPYPVGAYQVSLASFYVGKYGDLVMGRIKLEPIVAEASSKKAA